MMKLSFTAGALILAGWIAAAPFEAPPRSAGIESPMVYQLSSQHVMPQGTIRFSFRWIEPDAKSYITLVQLDGADGMLRLYVYPHPHFGFLALRTFKDRSRSETLAASRRLIDFWRKNPETMHRIVLTWTPTEGRLYLDGFPVSTSSVFAEKKVSFSRILWGGVTVHYSVGKSSVFTKCRYELGRLEITPEVMSPDAVIADWRSMNPGYKEADHF